MDKADALVVIHALVRFMPCPLPSLVALTAALL